MKKALRSACPKSGCAAPGKEGGHASVVEAGVLEVAEHGIRVGMGHGVRVLGLAPGAVLLAVAAGTTVTADKPGGHRRCRSCRRRYLGCGLGVFQESQLLFLGLLAFLPHKIL